MRLTDKQFKQKIQNRRPPRPTGSFLKIGKQVYRIWSDDSLRREPRVIRGKALRKTVKKIKQRQRVTWRNR